MRFRIIFLIVTAFFVTMNVMLWRSEYGARGQFGAPVPAELVWEKVLHHIHGEGIVGPGIHILSPADGLKSTGPEHDSAAGEQDRRLGGGGG